MEALCLTMMLISIVFKCNIYSLVYILLLCYYIWVPRKYHALIASCVTVGICFSLQYFLYVANFTTFNTPQGFVVDTYPTVDESQSYLFPIFFKFELF